MALDKTAIDDVTFNIELEFKGIQSDSKVI